MTDPFATEIERFALPTRLRGALLAEFNAINPAEAAHAPLLNALARVADAGVTRLPDDPVAGSALARVAYAAPFLLHYMARGAERLGSLLTDLPSADLVQWRHFASPEATPELDEAEAMRRMRLWKYDSYFRLTARNLMGLADTRTTCRAISDLADGLVRLALGWSFQRMARTHGLPVRANGRLSAMAVLGMGKLGGRELNYSSDIDLILLHDGDDHPVLQLDAPPTLPIDLEADEETHWERWRVAPQGLGGKEGRITNGEWHQRVGRQMVRMLSTHSSEGIAFRTDMDLRPEGKGGMLVTPVSFALGYYDVQGREWERAALIKARSVAGDRSISGPFLKAIRPFVYRRYLDYSAMEGIALIKHDIDRHHQGALAQNLKLGGGGIRENEFFVQALQLLYGGRKPDIQVTSHEAAVRALVAAAILPARDGEEILSDYWALRERENRVQMVEERQTQELPEPFDDKLRVFHDFKSGFPARLPVAEHALSAARDRTAERFRGLFRGMALASGQTAPQAAEWQEALRAHTPPELVEERLARVDALINRLMRSRIGERCVFKLTGLLTRPELYAQGTADPFARWLEFLEQIGNRNALFTLLEANSPIVPWVTRIFAEGGIHAQPLIRHPEFLESYLGGSASAEAVIRNRFDTILASTADEEEFIVEVQMAKAQVQIQILSLCLSDVDPVIYRRQLSILADETVRVCLEFAWRSLTRRLGLPQGAHEGSPVKGFAVLALGKLGTRELRFSSDLDLIFIYEGAGTTHLGKSHYELFTKLAHKVSNLLTTPTQFGKLYDLDHRLRPFGTRGLLVPSLAGFQDFLAQADTWNFQAFTRLRAIAGDPDLAKHLAPAIAAEWTHRAMPTQRIAGEIWQMLERLVRQNFPSDEGEPRLPLKFAVGGMLGFEFLRQFYYLAHCAENADAWTAPEDHAIIKQLQPDYDSLNALDERVSFYRESYQHVIGAEDFRRYAAVNTHWRFDAVAAQCAHLEKLVANTFASLIE